MSVDDVARMRERIRELRSTSDRLRAEASSVRERAARERLRTRSERDQAVRDLQAEARTGRLGEDMARLARAVERGESSWYDVIRGRDTSPEASALRAQVAAAAERWRQEESDGSGGGGAGRDGRGR